MPTFSAPIDCTPWVIGGLWPEELSNGRAETATLARYLKVDLQRIASSANDDLRAVRRVGMDYAVRRDAEARVIDEARDLAVRRVESTMRQLRQMGQHLPSAGSAPSGANSPAARPPAQAQSNTRGATRPVDLDCTQVLPAVEDVQPATTDSVSVFDDQYKQQQPDGIDQVGLSEDADKHRLRRLDG